MFDVRKTGLLNEPMPTQQSNPYAGILGLDAPMPEYEVNMRPLADVPIAIAKGMYESAQIPAKAIRGDYGIMSVDNPLLTDAAAQFTVDFGLLPAVGMSAVAKPDANTLRMGMGGSDTVSGGMRQQPSMARDVDDLGFYSQALESAKGFSQLKGTGDQYRAMLLKAGVKPDEIAFTPELEGLLSQPQVTKDELVGLLQENRIRPQETVYYGGDTAEFSGLNFPDSADELDVYQAYGREYLGERTLDMMYDDPEHFMDEIIGELPASTQYGEITDTREDILKALQERDLNSISAPAEILLKHTAERRAIEEYSYDPVYRLRDPDTGYEIVGSDTMGYSIRERDGDIIADDFIGSLDEAKVQAESHALDRGVIDTGVGGTRFKEYTEQGGDNYREMLLQVPEYAGKTDEFVYSGHFDEPDIVVHARTKDRDSANDVGDVLYVEELQSDFAQQGRRQGFRDENQQKIIADAEELLATAERRRDEATNSFGESFNSFGMALAEKMSEKAGTKVIYDPERQKVMYETPPMASNSLAFKERDLFGRREMHHMYRSGEPLTPNDFPSSFTDKEIRSIRPSNATQLRNALDEAHGNFVDAMGEVNASKTAMTPAPFVKNSQKFAEVGVKRLLNQAVKEGKDFVSFSSGDVQLDRWSEKGLVPFYDEIIPKVAKKVVKKLDPDAKPDYMPIDDVEDFGGNMGTNRFTIEITPKMREEILKGQQLFTAPNAPVPASGLLGDEKIPDDATEFLLLQDRLAAQGIGLL